MTALILHPHTISDLTLTSVRRNNVLELAQSFPRTKSSKFNNKKQQQKKYTIVFTKTRATLWYKKICQTLKNRKKFGRAH